MGAFAELKAFITGNADGFKAAAKDATGHASTFSKSISGIGGMLATAFSVGAVVSFGKKLLQTADEMGKIASATNLTMAQVTAMKTLAGESSLEFSDMATALGKVRDAQGQAVSLAKPMIEALKTLNINVEDFVGAGTDEALAMVGRAFVAAGGSAESYSAVKDIIGKNSKDMLEALKALDAEGLGPLAQRTREAAKGFEDLAAADATIDKFFNGVTLKSAKALNSVNEFWNALQQPATKGDQTADAMGMPKWMTGLFQIGRAAGDVAGRSGPGILPQYDQKEQDAKLAAIRNGTNKAGPNASDVETLRKNKENARIQEELKWQENANAEILKSERMAEDQARERSRLTGDNSEALAKASDNARGRGVNADSVARIGGSIGGSRPGLAIEDRAIKIQQDQLEVMRDFNRKMAELLDKQNVANIRLTEDEQIAEG